MRYFFIALLLCLLFAGTSNAFYKKNKQRGGPKTEVELMNSVVSCLSRKDTASYYYLFPPFDTLWRMVIRSKLERKYWQALTFNKSDGELCRTDGSRRFGTSH